MSFVICFKDEKTEVFCFKIVEQDKLTFRKSESLFSTRPVNVLLRQRLRNFILKIIFLVICYITWKKVLDFWLLLVHKRRLEPSVSNFWMRRVLGEVGRENSYLYIYLRIHWLLFSLFCFSRSKSCSFHTLSFLGRICGILSDFRFMTLWIL